MKKQWIAIIYIFLLIAGALLSTYKEPLKAHAEEPPVVIPDEAIRLRILANSNSDADQSLKREIRDEVNKEITKWVKDLTSIEEARKLIKSRLPHIKAIAEGVLKKEHSKQTVKAEFNSSVDFPTKMYGNYIYPAGNYEAILITLGNGEGANWWCVLFPPLCFLDFSNGEAVKDPGASQPETKPVQTADNKQNGQKVEVKFFLVEWFESLFS
ncbi:stage II sporulation protein R [Metabacillus sp. GX 13764]|uniref:stage II sporulation protein R n=1 Tax=Metabacillus kandeliae TaxID=2900151 RepID=UPI001E532EC8|nr:stage II sporulation protein R [Metabacillus kandeliae]MCD7034680.1 stage II sporulation protein R [Metabacillus kandeliae]